MFLLALSGGLLQAMVGSVLDQQAIRMAPFLFITDLDHTLVGDDAAMVQLNQHLSRHRDEYGTKIVYSTGRSPSLYQELLSEKSLLPPDAVVTGVGTGIYYGGSAEPDRRWYEQLNQGWQRDRILAITGEFAALEPQPAVEQNDYKVSFFLDQAIATDLLPQLEANLRAADLQANVVYSGGEHLDILPQGANKGLAMVFLRQQWNFAPERTVACGDSGNDLSMFHSGAERGIIVGNAMAELRDWHQENPSPNRYLATSHCAAGILEGLGYFGFLDLNGA